MIDRATKEKPKEAIIMEEVGFREMTTVEEATKEEVDREAVIRNILVINRIEIISIKEVQKIRENMRNTQKKRSQQRMIITQSQK